MSILECCTLFQGIKPATLNRVEAISEKHSYAAGKFVLQSGQPARHLHILEKGRIRLPFSDGGQVAYTVSNPGEVFGWSSMVNQPEYILSAQTVSEVTILRIQSKELQQIFLDDPASGFTFYRHLAEFIGQKLANSYKATVFVHGERSSLSYG